MIGKLIKGKGAHGLCAYLMGHKDHNGDERPRADVIGGTLAGRNASELTRELGQLHDLRPALGVHVAHVSLRVPADERALSDSDWTAIGEQWAQGMGFEAYAIISHGDHIHIAASRVRLDGGVVSDAQDWKRSEALIRAIEREHGLHQVEASHLLEPERATTHRKAPTMERIALAEKGGRVAAEVVADLVAMQLDRGTVSASDFVRRLETAGVTVIPNLASTGKLSGFAYEMDGERVTASAMGRGFTLANLTKRGLTYEPNRDLTFLNARRRGGAAGDVERPDAAPGDAAARPGGEGGGVAPDPGSDRGSPGSGVAARGDGNGPADRGNPPDAGAHRRERPRGARTDGRAPQGPDGEVSGGGRPAGNGHVAGREDDAIAHTSDEPGGRGEAQSVGAGAGIGAAAAAGRDGAGVETRRAAPVSEAAMAPERRTEARQEGGAPAEVRNPAPAPGPALRALQAVAGTDRSLAQVRDQLRAFGADLYEVQPIAPKGVELAKERIRKWTAEQVEKGLGWLRRMNVLGYDIYVRPAPPASGGAQPLAFVDDVDQATVDQMRADGFPFAVLNESSPGRFHGWVRIADEPLARDEVTLAAKLLARRYGADVNSADWRHYGRLAGTTNQKPSRRTERGAPFVLLRAASRDVAPGGPTLLLQAQVTLEQAEHAALNARAAARQAAPRTDGADLGDATAAFAEARARATPSRADDESARDFAACLSLLRRGFDQEEVADAMRDASPDLAGRHAQPETYISRTVTNAAARVGSTLPPIAYGPSGRG